MKGKNSITRKGKHYSPRTEFKKGHHSSPNTEFKKGHKVNLGKYRSEESKINMSKSRLARKKKLGYLNSKEIRRKISLANKGKHLSPNTEFKKGSIPKIKGKNL